MPRSKKWKEVMEVPCAVLAFLVAGILAVLFCGAVLLALATFGAILGVALFRIVEWLLRATGVL